MSRKGTESLKELVTCPICFDRMNRPKMLPCQHSFCLMCLENCTVEGTKLRCPQCRAEHSPSKEGAAGFPVNIYLQSILDLLDSDYAVVDEFLRCSSCQTVCDATECEHCNRSYCQVCQDRHLDELKRQLGQIAEHLDASTNKQKSRFEVYQGHCQTIKEGIVATAENKIRDIRDKEVRLIQGVDEELEQERLGCADAAHRLGQLSDKLKTAVDREFDSLGNAAEKMSFFIKLHHESSEALSDVSSSEQGKLSFDREAFVVTVDKRSEANMGSDDENREPEVVEEEQASSAKSEVKVKEEADQHSRFYRSKSFSPKAKLGSGLLQRPSGIAVSPWSHEIFVVAMDNHRVFVFDFQTGRLHRSFGSRGQKPGEFLCPFGIALSPPGQQILVTDKWKHCIHVFGKDGKFQKQLGNKGRSPGHFRSPESISVDRNGRIYVCDTCNNRIQVLDSNGAFVSEIGTRSQVEAGSLRHRSMFQEPTGIAVSPDGQKVVVCDFGNHRVHVFSSSGNHVLTFGQKGVLRGQFIHPECVAVDNMGFVFIGDSGNGRVQICRPDGRFVRAFGSKGSNNGQFSWISGIAITDRHDIVISDFKNHCVQIF